MSCWFNLSIWLVKKILSALVIRRYACSHWNYCSSLLAYCINMELQMAGALILVQLLIIWLQNKRIQCHDAFASDDLIIIACITTQLPSLTLLPLQSWHYCISLFWQAATQLCQHNVADRRINGHGLRIASVRSTNIFLLAVPLLLEFVYSPLSCIFVQYQVFDTKRKGEAVCVKKYAQHSQVIPACCP